MLARDTEQRDSPAGPVVVWRNASGRGRGCPRPSTVSATVWVHAWSLLANAGVLAWSTQVASSPPTGLPNRYNPPDQTGDALRRISPHVGGDDLVDLDADSHLSVRPSRFE